MRPILFLVFFLVHSVAHAEVHTASHGRAEVSYMGNEQERHIEELVRSVLLADNIDKMPEVKKAFTEIALRFDAATDQGKAFKAKNFTEMDMKVLLDNIQILAEFTWAVDGLLLQNPDLSLEDAQSLAARNLALKFQADPTRMNEWEVKIDSDLTAEGKKEFARREAIFGQRKADPYKALALRLNGLYQSVSLPSTKELRGRIETTMKNIQANPRAFIESDLNTLREELRLSDPERAKEAEAIVQRYQDRLTSLRDLKTKIRETKVKDLEQTLKDELNSRASELKECEGDLRRFVTILGDALKNSDIEVVQIVRTSIEKVKDKSEYARAEAERIKGEVERSSRSIGKKVESEAERAKSEVERALDAGESKAGDLLEDAKRKLRKILD